MTCQIKGKTFRAGPPPGNYNLRTQLSAYLTLAHPVLNPHKYLRAQKNLMSLSPAKCAIAQVPSSESELYTITWLTSNQSWAFAVCDLQFCPFMPMVKNKKSANLSIIDFY